jgi:3-oxoacyl-[acyl-carrier protein] reductase
MDLGIEGRVALVMGASRGLGRAVAAALAREGARVAIASRSPDRIGEAADAIEGEVAHFVADASDPARLPALVADVAERLGPVEILVANAGGPPFGGALEHGVEEWEEAYRSLVLAPMILARAVVPEMRDRG